MKILMVIPYVPNLISVRPYNLIRQLAARGHELTLVTMYRTERERSELERLRPDCTNVIALGQKKQRTLWNLLRTLPTRFPLQSAYCWDPRLAQHLSRLIGADSGMEPFDIVHVEHLRAARYGLYLNAKLSRRGVRPKTPVVWDSVDCISLLFERAAKNSRSLFGRWVTRFELGRTRRYEAMLSRQFDHILMTTPGDRNAMMALVDDRRDTTPISVLSNGVDLQYFVPSSNGARAPSTVLVSGKMSYHANVTMALYLADEIMPRIWENRPDVKLNIVGKDPPGPVRSLSEDPRINVTGLVPDVRPYLQSATVAVAPVQYGVGIQNKVLEAMACATPVVASSQASSALAARAGEDLFVVDDSDAFAEAVLRLLGDSNLQRALGSSGRKYVERNHKWSTIAANLECIYRETIARVRSAAEG